MSALLKHRIDFAPAEDRTALSHNEFIMSSSATASLVRILAEGHHEDLILPDEKPEDEQFFISNVPATRVKKALEDIRFNITEDLSKLLDAAERHDFLINVDHGFLNKDGGAISRAISPDEW